MYIVFLAMLSLAVSFDDGTDEVTEEAGQEEIAGLTNDSIQEEQPLSSRVFVIPTSRNVMRGSKFEAQIVLAEIDTLHDPQIFIDSGKRLLLGTCHTRGHSDTEGLCRGCQRQG